MPNSSSEIEEVLRSRPPKVVPAIFLFDASVFATSANEHFKRVREKNFETVVLSGETSKLSEVSARFFTSGFHQAILPLTLMDDVPGWCVWFLSSDTTDVESFLLQLDTLEQERPGRFHHLLFLSTDKPDEAKVWAPDPSTRRHLPFLLCRTGVMDRSDPDLARAAVAYVYAGWKKYWELGDANLAGALSLPHDSRVLTLGMSVSELDVEFHAKRWGQNVAEGVREQLLSKTRKVENPSLHGIKELVRFLLPDWYLASPDAGNTRSITVKMGDDSTNVNYLDRKESKPHLYLSHREHFQELLGRLKDKFNFLTFIALANTRRFVLKKANRLGAEVWSPIQTCLQLPENSDSIIDVLTNRAKQVACYAEDMRKTRIEGQAPSGSFPQDYKNVWARISAIPNRLGAFMRLGLIAIGFSGLILCPFWWGGIRHPLADELLRNIAFGAAVLLAGCVVGVLIHFYYAALRADNEFELAETNIELRHLREVSALAIQELHKEGNVLKKRIDDLREDLEALSEGLKKGFTTTPDLQRSPTGSWLSDNSVDVLMHPRLSELIGKVYTLVAEDLNKSKDNAGLVNLDSALWRRLTEKHAIEICKETLGRLTFDQCVAVMGPSPHQKETLIYNLAREASQPAWPGRSDTGSPMMCYADPNKWRENRGRHDTLAFYELDLKDMLVVSIIPLREFS